MKWCLLTPSDPNNFVFPFPVNLDQQRFTKNVDGTVPKADIGKESEGSEEIGRKHQTNSIHSGKIEKPDHCCFYYVQTRYVVHVKIIVWRINLPEFVIRNVDDYFPKLLQRARSLSMTIELNWEISTNGWTKLVFSHQRKATLIERESGKWG